MGTLTLVINDFTFDEAFPNEEPKTAGSFPFCLPSEVLHVNGQPVLQAGVYWGR